MNPRVFMSNFNYATFQTQKLYSFYSTQKEWCIFNKGKERSCQDQMPNGSVMKWLLAKTWKKEVRECSRREESPQRKEKVDQFCGGVFPIDGLDDTAHQ